MEVIDNKTPLYNLPLPNEANPLKFDVKRLNQSLGIIDSELGKLKSLIQQSSDDTKKDLASILDKMANDLQEVNDRITGNRGGDITSIQQTIASINNEIGILRNQIPSDALQSNGGLFSDINKKLGINLNPNGGLSILNNLLQMNVFDNSGLAIQNNQLCVRLTTASELYNQIRNYMPFFRTNTIHWITQSGVFRPPVTGHYFCILIGGGDGSEVRYGDNNTPTDYIVGNSGCYIFNILWLEKDRDYNVTIGHAGNSGIYHHSQPTPRTVGGATIFDNLLNSNSWGSCFRGKQGVAVTHGFIGGGYYGNVYAIENGRGFGAGFGDCISTNATFYGASAGFRVTGSLVWTGNGEAEWQIDDQCMGASHSGCAILFSFIP